MSVFNVCSCQSSNDYTNLTKEINKTLAGQLYQGRNSEKKKKQNNSYSRTRKYELLYYGTKI